MVDSSHMIVISSVRNEFEEAVVISWSCIVSVVSLGSSSCLLAFLKIVEPQESAE